MIIAIFVLLPVSIYEYDCICTSICCDFDLSIAQYFLLFVIDASKMRVLSLKHLNKHNQYKNICVTFLKITIMKQRTQYHSVGIKAHAVCFLTNYETSRETNI